MLSNLVDAERHRLLHLSPLDALEITARKGTSPRHMRGRLLDGHGTGRGRRRRHRTGTWQRCSRLTSCGMLYLGAGQMCWRFRARGPAPVAPFTAVGLARLIDG